MILRAIYFLLFFVILVYPHGLLEGTYLNYIYVVFSFICFLIFDTKNSIKSNNSSMFFLLLFLIVTVGNIVSALKNPQIDLFSYVSSSLRYLTFFLIYTILLSTTNTSKQFYFWVKSFIFAYTLSLIILFLDAYRVLWVENVFKVKSFEELNTLDVYFRAYGSYLSPISAGTTLLNVFIVLFPSILILDYYFNKKQKLILFTLSIASVLGILTTASRTSLLGLSVAILCIFYFTNHKKKILAASCLALLILFQFDLLGDYVQNIQLRNERDSAYGSSLLEGSGRYDTYTNSIRLFLDSRTFFSGVGPTEYSIGDSNFSLAHNGFLSVLLCFGLMGGLLFIYYFSKSYKKINRLKLKRSSVNNYLRVVFITFIIANAVTFISSDGPITLHWMYCAILLFWIIDRSLLTESEQNRSLI